MCHPATAPLYHSVPTPECHPSPSLFSAACPGISSEHSTPAPYPDTLHQHPALVSRLGPPSHLPERCSGAWDEDIGDMRVGRGQRCPGGSFPWPVSCWWRLEGRTVPLGMMGHPGMWALLGPPAMQAQGREQRVQLPGPQTPPAPSLRGTGQEAQSPCGHWGPPRGLWALYGTPERTGHLQTVPPTPGGSCHRPVLGHTERNSHTSAAGTLPTGDGFPGQGQEERDPPRVPPSPAAWQVVIRGRKELENCRKTPPHSRPLNPPGD